MITLRHITFGRTPLDECSSPTRRSLPDNTQHSQETNIHAPGGIRTSNPSKQAAAEPRLKRRGHRDRPSTLIRIWKCVQTMSIQRWLWSLNTVGQSEPTSDGYHNSWLFSLLSFCIRIFHFSTSSTSSELCVTKSKASFVLKEYRLTYRHLPFLGNCCAFR